MAEFTDDSLMPFGTHKGKALANVPAQHLIWLLENRKAGRIEKYIRDNLEVLKMETKKR